MQTGNNGSKGRAGLDILGRASGRRSRRGGPAPSVSGGKDGERIAGGIVDPRALARDREQPLGVGPAGDRAFVPRPRSGRRIGDQIAVAAGWRSGRRGCLVQHNRLEQRIDPRERLVDESFLLPDIAARPDRFWAPIGQACADRLNRRDRDAQPWPGRELGRQARPLAMSERWVAMSTMTMLVIAAAVFAAVFILGEWLARE